MSNKLPTVSSFPASLGFFLLLFYFNFSLPVNERQGQEIKWSSVATPEVIRGHSANRVDFRIRCLTFCVSNLCNVLCFYNSFKKITFAFCSPFFIPVCILERTSTSITHVLLVYVVWPSHFHSNLCSGNI